MFKEGDVLCEKYLLKRRFNKGGFSQVWLALDLKAKREFALKIYAPDGGLDDDGIDEFRQEFNLVVNLNHSNIFKPLTYDIHGNIPFLVMPYCTNGSTTSLIGKIDEDSAWRFAHDVAAGLAYLHEHKSIVHQDIKPGNILIDDDGKYMITDFGISTKLQKTVRMTAKQALEMQDHNYGSGTPEYMGPERWPKEGYVPPMKPIYASDIWSLGATLFELMTGHVPFRETGGAMQRLTHAIPNIPGQYSKELKKLVIECMEEEPWKRPNAKMIADNALQHKAPVRQPNDRKKLIYGSIAGLAVIACIAIGIWFGNIGTGTRDEDEEVAMRRDSTFLAQVEEAAKIIVSTSETSEKYNNYALDYIRVLSQACILYQNAMATDSITDSVRKKAIELWAKSQSVIDSEYQYFRSQETRYAELDEDERPAAADSFAQRCKDISAYVSDNIKQ